MKRSCTQVVPVDLAPRSGAGQESDFRYSPRFDMKRSSGNADLREPGAQADLAGRTLVAVGHLRPLSAGTDCSQFVPDDHGRTLRRPACHRPTLMPTWTLGIAPYTVGAAGSVAGGPGYTGAALACVFVGLVVTLVRWMAEWLRDGGRTFHRIVAEVAPRPATSGGAR